MFSQQVYYTIGHTRLLYLLFLCILVSSLATLHEETEAPRRCKSNEFECANGICIVDLWRCDEDDDCRDNSDEINCPEVVIVCSEDQFKCDTDTCIPRGWLCDQELDCNDGSDEQGCTLSRCPEQMFQCADLLSCIPAAWRCDWEPDCGDLSDEMDCEALSVTPTFTCTNGTRLDIAYRCDAIPQCQQGEDESECSDCPGILCSNRRCIQASQYCDGVSDCKNGDDEPLSCNPSCMVENGGCEHICLQNEDTVVCDCHDGFELFNNIYCVDHNECTDDGYACPGHPMLCFNELGTFRCACPPDFIFDTDQQTCYANDSVSPPVIFSSQDGVMYLPNVNTQMTRNLTPENDFLHITAIDFDPQAGTIFFSDAGRHQILKYFLTTGEAEVIADEGVEMVDGIAYDWIYGNLYFTETQLNKIEVIYIRTLFRRVLFQTDLDEPRGIAVHPIEGYLYFTDWGEHPKIEKAAMDGSSRQIIIDENLFWPNGLCIEYTLRRLFWVNAVPPSFQGSLQRFQGSFIASSDLDGGRIQILVEDPLHVRLPFAISVLQDTIYWTDRDTQSLMTANSFTGANWSVVLRNLPTPMDIRVFNRKAKYDAENPCPTDKYACSHMCLASPNSNHYSCGCPNNAFLGEDMRTCFCNTTVKMNEDGVTCRTSGLSTPANEVAVPVGTQNPVEETIIKFKLSLKCRIFDWSLKCKSLDSLTLLAIPDDFPEDLNCQFSKNEGELICKY